MKAGSLCSGYGGLDLAATQLFPGLRTAWFADNDPGAAAVLTARFPGIPNLGDLRTADLPPVDVLTAGFPCQPVSCAGRRKGTSDERWLWDDICAAIGQMVTRPRLLLLENVPGLLSANGGDAMARVVHGLATFGYEHAYRLVRASEAGAPHRRERWFCLAWLAAHPDGAASGQRRQPAPQQAAGRRPRADSGRRSGALAANPGRDTRTGDLPDFPATARPSEVTPADATGDGRHERWPEPARLIGRPDAAERGHGPAADAKCGGQHGRPPLPEWGSPGRTTAAGDSGDAVEWGRFAPAIHRWETVLGRPAPRPVEPGRTAERLSPAFVEWMMGLSPGHVTGIPGLSRNAQLRLLGNGVVPQQAVLAFTYLLALPRLPRSLEVAA